MENARTPVSEWLRLLAMYAEAGEVPHLSKADIAEIREASELVKMGERATQTVKQAQKRARTVQP